MRFVLPFLLAALASGFLHAEAPPIQEWIDEAIKAGGGVVTIPEGEHMLPQGLVIKDARKLALRGVNKERCILKLQTRQEGQKASDLILITGACETLEIANLTLDAGPESKSVVFVDGNSAPKETRIQDIYVRDCLFQNVRDYAVLFSNADACVVERCSFQDGSDAIGFIQGCLKGIARGNQIIRMSSAFHLENSSDCLLDGNEVRNGDQGVRISSHEADVKPVRHVIRNNGFFNVRLGLQITGQAPEPVLENNENLVNASQ
ncbi:parallel beta helix pectate lyase-like protein [Prosthecobacter fusiformis]|uniref:Parallel beta helix pectate lyase-like protein n=1 Tax=Prosthecobacter fusiformis TaxID=48464 RepID=A0A4V3FI80_9BACT|nr:right-handed parallel beta-helix repeat-containing protein [Prosthecobacter fusiformis]TDU81373.1 parallel beta helix pectate lyase-like protein [Prosthecobacter fusiformis]